MATNAVVAFGKTGIGAGDGDTEDGFAPRPTAAASQGRTLHDIEPYGLIRTGQDSRSRTTGRPSQREPFRISSLVPVVWDGWNHCTTL